jgi:hypothetical protein
MKNEVYGGAGTPICAYAFFSSIVDGNICGVIVSFFALGYCIKKLLKFFNELK